MGPLDISFVIRYCGAYLDPRNVPKYVRATQYLSM